MIKVKYRLTHAKGWIEFDYQSEAEEYRDLHHPTGVITPVTETVEQGSD